MGEGVKEQGSTSRTQSVEFEDDWVDSYRPKTYNLYYSSPKNCKCDSSEKHKVSNTYMNPSHGNEVDIREVGQMIVVAAVGAMSTERG